MLALGFLLLAAVAVATVGGVLVSDGKDVALYGIDMSPMALFVVGLACGVLALVSFRLILLGTKREVRVRREHRQVAQQERRQQEAVPPSNEPPAQS
ncbi:hypothetical protein NODU109028_00810 [Nocardioides dubius]|uniref:Lipopolysaccharide assembly protein A domain-containing protein n=1 Tax=Nocardioides dubius TaxID=317019 RepID=A0ABP4ELL5_9ACTN